MIGGTEQGEGRGDKQGGGGGDCANSIGPAAEPLRVFPGTRRTGLQPDLGSPVVRVHRRRLRRDVRRPVAREPPLRGGERRRKRRGRRAAAQPREPHARRGKHGHGHGLAGAGRGAAASTGRRQRAAPWRRKQRPATAGRRRCELPTCELFAVMSTSTMNSWSRDASMASIAACPAPVSSRREPARDGGGGGGAGAGGGAPSGGGAARRRVRGSSPLGARR
jgi:hypothetical protein